MLQQRDILIFPLPAKFAAGLFLNIK